MTKEEKQRCLEAIKELRQHYLRKKKVLFCPLCRLCYSCTDCLWKLLENSDCEAYAEGEFKYSDAGDLREESFSKNCSPNAELWRTRALRRLSKWKKKIEAM